MSRSYTHLCHSLCVCVAFACTSPIGRVPGPAASTQAGAEVRPGPDGGAIVPHHASIIHRELEKVAKCVCLLNN